MNKKAIAILGAIFVLIVGTLGFLIYSKYSGSSSSQPGQNTNNTATNTGQSSTGTNPSPSPATPSPQPTNPTPTPAVKTSSNLVKLTDDQVVSPALFFNGLGITYFDRQGNLFQASFQDSNGQMQLTGKKQLAIPPKAGISKILWPAKGNDFIAQITDSNGKNSWSYFNSSAGTYTGLPSQVESVDWMPNGTQIMYVWVDKNKASLSLGNPDTSNYKTLADMWELDDTLSVSPYGDQVLYYETANSGASNSINSVTSDGKVWKGLVKNGFNMGVLWSPDSQKFLFSKKDLASQKYQLWVYNLTSGEIKNLGLFTTVDKTVWDKDSNIIYAAVPSSGAPGANSLTVDSFFRMDVSTLDKKQYASQTATPVDGRDLFLNVLGDKLFFRNAQDGGLYYLDLTK